DLPTGLVFRVEQFRWGVGHWVIGPGSELELPAVLGPGVTAARLRYEASEPRIGNDVRPRHGRAVGTADDNMIFAPFVGKAAVPVPEFQGCAIGVWACRRV